MVGEYKITSKYDPDSIIFILIDGESFGSRIEAKQYLIKVCGFSANEATEYIELLPEGGTQ